ncbi:MAG: hypothetical protein KFF50_03185, partial [Desulfatitalea sp.]|nr:hypothetical protein [Desulfatitalea sp.]
MPRRFARFIAPIITALLLLGLLSHCAVREPIPIQPAPLAEPAPVFNRLFSPGNGGWSGGDGTLSIPLPDGRTVWLFGDSLLGAVAPDR